MKMIQRHARIHNATELVVSVSKPFILWIVNMNVFGWSHNLMHSACGGNNEGGK